MIETKISVKDSDANIMYYALLPDLEKKGRSEIEIKKGKKELKINIKSPDPTSARASFNSFILKIRAMFELKESE